MRRRGGIVKTIAQADHPQRLLAGHQVPKAAQRRGRIVGRQRLAAPGKARGLLEMKIGDDNGARLIPDEGARNVGTKRNAAE